MNAHLWPLLCYALRRDVCVPGGESSLLIAGSTKGSPWPFPSS